MVLGILHQGGKGAQLTRHIRTGPDEDDFGGTTRLEVGEVRASSLGVPVKLRRFRHSSAVGAVVLVHLAAVTEMQRQVSGLRGDALEALAPGAPVRERIDCVAGALQVVW